MRRTVTVVLWCLALTLQAQGVVWWKETSHDFGTLREENGAVTCMMRFVNRGDSAVLISRVQPTCGCTAADYTLQAVQPGDTGLVRLKYSPAGRPGEFRKSVFVYTAGSTVRRHELVITGNVIPRPETLDETYPVAAGSTRLSVRLLPLGPLTRGQGRMAYVSGYNAAADTMLVSAGHVAPHLIVTVVPDTVAPGTVFTVNTYYNSAKAPLWGLNTDTVAVVSHPLRTDGTGKGGVAMLEVTAQVQEDFSRLTDRQLRNAPHCHLDCGDRLDFATLNPQEPVSRVITISNEGKSPLEIRRLWSPDPAVAVSVDKNSLRHRKTARVTVTVNPAKLSGELLNTWVTVITNDPDHPTTDVRLVGIIANQQ